MNSIQNMCHQGALKLKNLKEDLKLTNIPKLELMKMKVSDLDFRYVNKKDKEECRRIKEFVERHEWLGKMPNRPTQRFAAYYKGEIVGVVIMATPYSFSHLLGRENYHLEKLIARGASISWAPKNTASWLIMQSINWMVKNTQFRYFSGYSDPRAKELGTIYQACGFIHLGKKSGTRYEYRYPNNPDKGWFSDRVFRKVGSYKRYAKDNDIEWQSNWSEGFSMQWQNIPKETMLALKDISRAHQNYCDKRKVPPKHKYTLIKGHNKKETKKLINLFKKYNPKLIQKNNELGLPYPKVRGE